MGFRLLAAALLFASVAWTVTRPDDIPFEKHTIDLGASEAAAVADINGDGKLDIVSGENWYQNSVLDQAQVPHPEFPGQLRRRFQRHAPRRQWRRPYRHRDRSLLRPQTLLDGESRQEGDWKEHLIDSGYPVEFALQVDLVNDGKKREFFPNTTKPTLLSPGTKRRTEPS